jgi:SRSO17 transposase
VHVPQQIAFATKPHLARAMVERAIAAGVPFTWVLDDSIYGVSEVERALRRTPSSRFIIRAIFASV